MLGPEGPPPNIHSGTAQGIGSLRFLSHAIEEMNSYMYSAESECLPSKEERCESTPRSAANSLISKRPAIARMPPDNETSEAMLQNPKEQRTPILRACLGAFAGAFEKARTVRELAQIGNSNFSWQKIAEDSADFET